MSYIPAKNDFIKKEVDNLSLFIDDNELSRANISVALNDKKYFNLVVPSKKEDCEKIIPPSKRFRRAVIDYNLKEWVGEPKERAIRICGHECYTGIQIAQALREFDPGLEIALFSSFKGQLQKSVQQIGPNPFIILMEERGLPNQHITSFIEKSHERKLIVKPLHNLDQPLPKPIQSFFAKKLVNSLIKGKHYWKAGNFLWLVGVDDEISAEIEESKNFSHFNSFNPIEEFLIEIDKNRFEASTISDKSTDLKTYFNDIPSKNSMPKQNAFIHNYFITQNICKKFLRDEIKDDEAIESMKNLDENSKFESQKILFKELPNSEKYEVSCKEDIHQSLFKFAENEFPQILEVFNCRVDSIEGNRASVKMESYSPEKSVRREIFNAEILKSNSIEESSQFEYTVYVPTIGGIARQIEPI